MLEYRSYLRLPRGRNWSATTILVASLVVAYILQTSLISPVAADNYLALSLDGMQHGYVWQLLSYQFMHGSWFHLFVNCWAIYVFGREVERMLGKARFLGLYFVSGVMGGLLQMLCAWFWPAHFGGAVVGASAGGFGLVAAFTAFDPECQLMLLLLFIIPLKMRAKTLLQFCLVLTGIGIAFPSIPILGAHIAHAAHLGGIATGLVAARCLFGSARRPLEVIA